MNAKRWIVVAVLVLLVVVGWALARPVQAVWVADVVRGDVRSYVEEEGRTRVTDRYVVSAPVDGRLLRVAIEEGDEVERDTVLAEIDQLPLRGRVDAMEARARAVAEQAKGVGTKRPKMAEIDRAKLLASSAIEARDVNQRQLAEARAELAQAARDARRARELAAGGSASVAEAEQAELAESRARQQVAAWELRVRLADLEAEAARLEAAVLQARLRDFDWEESAFKEEVGALEAELTVLRDDLARSRITAPVSGVVLKRFIESETVVAAGTPILELGDLARLDVEVDFLSEDAALMRPGMPAELFGGALGERVVAGAVKRVYPSAFQKISSLGVEQQRVTVVLAFDPPDGLGDGYRVDARVILDRAADVLLVPETALFRYEGEWHLFAVVEGRAHRTPVTTGLSDGRTREVRSGLEEGAAVVVHPPRDLEDGARIETE